MCVVNKQVFCDASSMTEVELQKCRELAEKHCHSFNYIEINSDLALEAGSVKLERAEIEPQDHKSIECIQTQLIRFWAKQKITHKIFLFVHSNLARLKIYKLQLGSCNIAH